MAPEGSSTNLAATGSSGAFSDVSTVISPISNVALLIAVYRQFEFSDSTPKTGVRRHHLFPFELVFLAHEGMREVAPLQFFTFGEPH
jgi:hypothetical protein